MQEHICGHVCVYVYAYMSDGWVDGWEAAERGEQQQQGGYGHYSSQQTVYTLVEQTAGQRWVLNIRGIVVGVWRGSLTAASACLVRRLVDLDGALGALWSASCTGCVRLRVDEARLDVTDG